jgi:hypothetical protein
MQPIFASRELAEPAGVMAEMALKAAAEKKRADDAMARLSALEAKITQIEASDNRALAALKDTHNSILGLNNKQAEPAAAVPVQASGPTTVLGAMAKVYIPNMSAMEMDILEREGLHAVRRVRAGGPINVVASTTGGGTETATIDALPPVDASVSSAVQNSLARRFTQTVPTWAHAFSHASDQFSSLVKLHNTMFERKAEATPQELGMKDTY